MAISLRALGAAGAAVVLTACATTPPPAVSASPSTGAASDSPAPSASGSAPSASPSAPPSGTPSVSLPPASTTIVLQAKGLDKANFGTAEKDVTTLLTARSGKPDDSYSGPVCELDSATPYGRQLVYGGAVFLFQSKAKGKANSPRTFTSWVEEVDFVHAGADLVALTSFNEGTPVSLIEAQAAGRAVVSTQVGGIENVVHHGVTGLLSPNNNIKAFSDNLLRLVEEDELRNRFAAKGWDQVGERYHYSRLVRDTANLYSELIA